MTGRMSDDEIREMMARNGLTDFNLAGWADPTGRHNGAKGEIAALILTVRFYQAEYLVAVDCERPQSVRNPRPS